jgi:hypothetical protein
MFHHVTGDKHFPDRGFLRLYIKHVQVVQVEQAAIKYVKLWAGQHVDGEKQTSKGEVFHDLCYPFFQAIQHGL